jgi:predicted nucleotidyltransferase/DNA-binding transcriptional ArsR family regulator
MLEDALSSPAKVKILRFLAGRPKQSFSLTEISKGAGITYRALHKQIHTLVESGAVEHLWSGKVKRYAIAKSKIGEVLIELFRTEAISLPFQPEFQPAIRVFVNYLPKSGVLGFALYGSVARREADPRSDLDIIIFCEQKRSIKNLVDRAMSKTYEKTDKEARPVLVEENGLSKFFASPLGISVRKEGVLINPTDKLKEFIKRPEVQV